MRFLGFRVGLAEYRCCAMEGELSGGESGGVGGGGNGVLRKPTPSRPQSTTTVGEATPGTTIGFKPLESPMSAMVSGFLADQEGGVEENRSFSHLLAGAINSPTSDSVDGGDGKTASMESGTNGSGIADAAGDGRSSSPGTAGGSFAERLAARGAQAANNKVSDGGGGPPRPPNSVRFKAMPPSRIPIPRQGGYLTIPPGLSPTTLFDSSPVLLSTSQVQVLRVFPSFLLRVAIARCAQFLLLMSSQSGVCFFIF